MTPDGQIHMVDVTISTRWNGMEIIISNGRDNGKTIFKYKILTRKTEHSREEVIGEAKEFILSEFKQTGCHYMALEAINLALYREGYGIHK